MFPTPINPGSKKREVFEDFGVIGNILLKDDLTFIQQYGCHAEELHASKPSLPLYPPNNASVTDCCYDIRVKRERISHAYDIMKRHVLPKAKREQRCTLERILNTLDDDDDEGELTPLQRRARLPEWLRQVPSLPGVYESPEYSRVNYKFSGGCASRLKINDTNLIFYVGGEEMNILKFFPSDETGKLREVEFQSRIYEINTTNVRNRGYVAVRLEGACDIYIVKDDLSVQPFRKQEFEDIPISISLSPYIPGEMVVACEDGTVRLWTTEDDIQRVVSNHKPRFMGTDDKWMQTHFSAHPRCLVLADRSQVELVDIRMPSNLKTSELLTLSMDLFLVNERFMCIKPYLRNSFYQFIGTDFSLSMVDERYPGTPVLLWRHCLRTPPQYISTLPLIQSCEPRDILLLGSQQEAETMVYSFNGQDVPPRSYSVPWRISPPDDFARFPEVRGKTVIYQPSIRERILNSSMIGVTGVENDKGGFTAYQLTCFGDLFYQEYNLGEPAQDKTYSAGPGSESLCLDDETVSFCVEWQKKLYDQVSDLESERQMTFSKADAWDTFNSINQRYYPHLLCRICMPENQKETGAKFGDKLSLKCDGCGCKLQEGENIIASSEKDMVIDSVEENEEDHLKRNLREVREPASEPHSILLTKLWKDDDGIQDLILQRNQLYKEREDARRKKAEEKIRRMRRKKLGIASPSPRKESSVISGQSSYSSLNMFNSPGFLGSPVRYSPSSIGKSPSRRSETGSIRSSFTELTRIQALQEHLINNEHSEESDDNRPSTSGTHSRMKQNVDEVLPPHATKVLFKTEEHKEND